jgi:hypothetical protein
MIRLLILIPLLAALSGCITMPKTGGIMTNHIVTTIDGQRCMTASRWWLVAITGDLNESECQALLEGQRLRAIVRELQPAQQQAPRNGGS